MCLHEGESAPDFAWWYMVNVEADGYPRVGDRVQPSNGVCGEGVSHFGVVGVEVGARRVRTELYYRELNTDTLIEDPTAPTEWYSYDAMVLVEAVPKPVPEAVDPYDEYYPIFGEIGGPHPFYQSFTWSVREVEPRWEPVDRGL